MAIDYEKEYDNRSRVPEHPEIFARWQREAAAFRKAARDAELGASYGPSPRQIIDLFAAKDDDSSTPLALFIHGGWWRLLEP
jgi:arylformamidase